jgi:integrase/recombinase XerD
LLFRPFKQNGKRREERWRIDADAIDRVVCKDATTFGLDHGYSAHSLRATFITTALEKARTSKTCRRSPGIA